MDQPTDKFKREWANIKTNCRKRVTWCDVERSGWALLSVGFPVTIRCIAIWPCVLLPYGLPPFRPESLGSEYDGSNVLEPWTRTILLFSSLLPLVFCHSVRNLSGTPTNFCYVALIRTVSLDSTTRPTGASTSVLGTLSFTVSNHHLLQGYLEDWFSSFSWSRYPHKFFWICFRIGPESCILISSSGF